MADLTGAFACARRPAHQPLLVPMAQSTLELMILQICQNRNRPVSALIRNLGNASQFAWKSFGNRPRLRVNMLCDQSPDPALNRETRRLSMPDRKSSLEKGRGGLAQSIS